MHGGNQGHADGPEDLMNRTSYKTGIPRRHPLTRAARHAAPGVTVYYNPATGKELGREPDTDLTTMPLIMEEAHEAQREWADRSFRERRKKVLGIRDYLIDHADEIAAVISENSGKTRIDALATEIIPSALSANWYAKNAGKILKSERPASSSILFFNKRNVIERVPLGVVGIISPWNYPFSIPFGEVLMGLMAGNAILLKVSGSTTKIGLMIRTIVQKAGMPRGLFHLLVGPGDAVSDAMIAHGIDKIFFTGSTATGTGLMVKASAHLVPVSLELGGKDAMIVLPDADLERAANGAAWAGYQNAGQSCGAVERLYVHEAVYDEFMGLLAAKTRATRFGPDTDFGVEMGAMTTRAQWETVDRHVKDALAKGARERARSERGAPVRGSFYPPLLLEGVDHSMEIMRHETFGPVIPVMKFKTVREAIALANDSRMGLTASVWTGSTRHGKEIASQLEAGIVTINDHLYTHGQPETPWGGWKESGTGFTHARLGLLEMTRARLINWDIIPSRRNIWWFPYNRDTYDRLKATLRLAFPRPSLRLIADASKAGGFIVKKMFTRWRT
jgi:acyl-CoA reductase-like NAD-dependent aldehyde dehydrogenase